MVASTLYDSALLAHSPNPSRDAVSLRRMRLAAELTQAELAERLGVSPVTVSKWETRRWSLPRLVLLAAEHVTCCASSSGQASVVVGESLVRQAVVMISMAVKQASGGVYVAVTTTS